MPNHTTNYNLIKPTPAEFYDIEVHNENMDTIDTQMKSTEDALTTHLDKIAQAVTATKNVAQTIPNHANTDLLFDNISTNDFCTIENGKIKITSSGIYEVILTVRFAASTLEGNRSVANNGNVAQQYITRIVDGLYMQAVNVVKLNAQQVLTLQVYQSTSSAADVLASGTTLRIRQVSDI